jgi:hypothetical protein
MRQELIDTLTRAMAAPAPHRSAWRVVATTATAGFWALLGRSLAQPQSAYASTDVSPGCLMLNNDGSCPTNTNKREQPGNVPTMNGCGPEGGSIKIPQGYGRADYTGSCNHHDVCYEECATPKDTCDQNFRDEMYDSCAAAYPGALNSLFRMGCYERAYAYYQAVSQFGDDAWIAAQYKACECCAEPTKVYCNCNKKCYDDVNVCLDECHTSLGCFTGICGPATADQCPA